MDLPIQITYIDIRRPDQEQVREVLAAAPFNYQTTAISDPALLWPHLENNPCDVIICELNLPGYPGIQLVEQIRSTYPHLPVVLLSSGGSETLAVAAMKLGAADYLVKSPEAIQSLPETIAAILQQRGLQSLSPDAAVEAPLHQHPWEQRLARLNECFLQFGKNPDDNIRRLVITCAELLNATCAVYNRLEGHDLHSLAHWLPSRTVQELGPAEGHICYDVIKSGREAPLIIHDLQHSPYAESDPNVQKFKLETYAGMAVKWNRRPIGSLCVVFQAHTLLSKQDLRLMNIIAVAISVEEERKHANEALTESEERFRMLVNASFDGVFIHQNGIIVEANQAFAHMVGGDHDKIINRPLIRFVAPETRDLMLRNIENNYEQIYEVVGMNLEGQKFPMEAVGRNCRYNGHPAHIIAVHDISERIRSQIELQTQLAYARALNRIAETIIIEENAAKILKRSAAIVGEMLRVDRSLIYRVSFKKRRASGLCEWLNPDVPDLAPTRSTFDLGLFMSAARHIRETRRHLESHRDRPHTAIGSDGAAEILHQQMNIASLLWYPFAFQEDGFHVFMVNQVRRVRQWSQKEIEFLDAVAQLVSIAMIKTELLNERRQLEQQLLQKRKMEAIGTLAGGIAHDFNNILGAILGFCEVSLGQLAEGGAIYDNLAQIHTAARRAREMVRQILTFSHRSDQERQPVQIHLLVKEALNLIRASLPTTIEIRRQIDPDCGLVLADPTQLHQVIMNLCTNAHYAMRNRTGTLTVLLETVTVDEAMLLNIPLGKAGRYVRLSVADEGTGIEQAILNRIFDPFFTTKPPGQGTGMGLSVVHGIVKGHGGAITVESRPGAGSRFDIYLPRIAGRETGDTATALPAFNELPRGTERVLLVDDEVPLVTVGEQILSRLGYRVTAETRSTAALATFSENPQQFDLLITDHTMPDMTGIELAQKVLAIRPELPVILVSGFSEIGTQERARQLGVREFLTKPVPTRDLVQAIRKIFDKAPRQRLRKVVG